MAIPASIADVEGIEAERERAGEELGAGRGIVGEGDLALEAEGVGDAEEDADALERERRRRLRLVRVPDHPQPARRRAGGQQLGEPDRPVDAEPAAPVLLGAEARAGDLHAEAVQLEGERLLEVEPAAGDRHAPTGVDAELLDADVRPLEPGRAHGHLEDAAEQEGGLRAAGAQGQGREVERPEAGDRQVHDRLGTGLRERHLHPAVAAQAQRDVDRALEERDLQRAADGAAGHGVLDERDAERAQREVEPGQRPGQLEAVELGRGGHAAAAEEGVVDRQRRVAGQIEGGELHDHVVQVQPGEVLGRAHGEGLAARRQPAHAPGGDDHAGFADHAARQRGRGLELDGDRALGGEPQADAPEGDVEPARARIRFRRAGQQRPQDRPVDPQADGDVEQAEGHREAPGPGLEAELDVADGELAGAREDQLDGLAEGTQRDLFGQDDDDAPEVAVLDRLEGGVREAGLVEERGEVAVERHEIAGDVGGGEQLGERGELPAFDVRQGRHQR